MSDDYFENGAWEELLSRQVEANQRRDSYLREVLRKKRIAFGIFAFFMFPLWFKTPENRKRIITSYAKRIQREIDKRQFIILTIGIAIITGGAIPTIVNAQPYLYEQ